MRYLSVFVLFLSTLFAHGKEHEHLHFLGSLHAEYFVFFVISLVGVYVVYDKFFKDNR